MGMLKDGVAALPASVRVGVAATVTMDATFLTAGIVRSEEFSSDKIGLELVGRWAAGLARGQYRHDDLPSEPPVPGEAALGLAVHVLTGIALTQAYYAMLRPAGRRPGPVTATAYGAATALLPLLVMYPSWGLGPCAVRSGEARRLMRIMLLGHSAFGAGIGLWTLLLAGGRFRRR
jgi:hypothetical protein